ncbi:MAG TPA: hypothetical protein DHV71_04040 [Acidaminococcaceae bacterium]|jgi:hypothetical protein|nr:DUF1659 domain-containing protein [Succiniclasticum sp.]MEE3479538.1 DUF1659 domain-containing protein [Succiniclasticum sp.]HAY61424.1 hypothetical protein [Acidaminococcaceae bacterium]HCJ91041.1 hypothetical protein [Acidaminococcaceae bacterium]
MAENFNVVKRTLGVVMENGVDAHDEMTYKTYLFSGVKPSAEKEAIIAAARALGGLIDAVMAAVSLTEKSDNKQA